jgi:succinoglycan biosynthesis protein ExoW
MKVAGPGTADAARIGVVIPYYQREAGLLRRALGSVAAQEHTPVQVVVVDDGSPRAAAEEITPELRAALRGLTVIRQANQGVAAARNAALDALADEVSAIALLDSDDYWQPAHLRRAATALTLGADFFFSNSRVEGETTDYFHQHPRRDLLANAQRIEEARDLKRWSADISALFGAGCIFRTATVVFRRGVMPDLRFPTEFRRAGEDQVAFWELLTRSSVIMFCGEPTLVYGSQGLGIWKNSTFGSAAHLVRLADEIRLRRHVLRNYPVSTGDRRLMRRAINERRQEALLSTSHLLRRRRLDVLNAVLYLWRVDPLCAASWCIDLPQLLLRKLRGARAPSG